MSTAGLADRVARVVWGDVSKSGILPFIGRAMGKLNRGPARLDDLKV
jgi:hypothetical protein